MYNKKLNIFDNIKEQTNDISNSDSQNDIELNLSPDEIQKQLKTQLELLKAGKRYQSSSISLKNPSISSSTSGIGTITPKLFTSSSDITKRLSLDRKSSFGSSYSSFDISLKDARDAGPSNKKLIVEDYFSDSSSASNQLKEPPKNCNINVINNSLINDNNKSIIENIEPINKKQQKPSNFIDSLLNKINSTNSNKKYLIKTEKTQNKIVKFGKKRKGIVPNEDDSLSSGEFLGFPDVEIIQSNIPGMLPTPIVPHKLDSTQSAFISEDLDKFMRDNLLDKTSDDNKIDKLPILKRLEDGLVCKGAIPPKLKMASLSIELGKPRTVAEKRILLQKNKNFKYLMIENENTIYHELKKRSRDCIANVSLIKSLQKQSIPATRDFWKATSWLITEIGKFYFQIANIDGIEYKIIGGYGNNTTKKISHQLCCPIKKLTKRLQCTNDCKDCIEFKNVKIRFNPNKENHKIHLVPNDVKDNNNYKPGPLSTKCSTFMPNYGPPEIYRMPQIQLEVYPKINRSLDDVCKSYLKMILPSKNITKEWAEFAVSTLISPSNSTTTEEKNISFTFDIPYLNDQENILVRRVYNRKEKFDKITTNDLKFRKIAYKSNDPITLECANILSDMIDSVALGLSEDSLIKNDPDIDYTNKIEETIDFKTENTKKSIKSEMKPNKKSIKKTGNPKSRLMSELKRLNATIIDAGGPVYNEEVKKQCFKPYCRFGCVCTSINGQPTLKKHCKKPDCMIECNCVAGLIEPDNANSSITSQDALMIRQKATARLARMEREFSSTVVLTNTETLLINESQYERKRRCTKRYLNYTGEEIEPSTTKSKVNSSNPPPIKRQRTSQRLKGLVTEAKLPKQDNIVYVDEDIMKKMKHCQIHLNKLQYFDNVEKWCMVHCLYKCFCKGKDLTGKPFILKKIECSEKDDIIYSRKPKYSFDKNEETITPPKMENETNSEKKKIDAQTKVPTIKIKLNNSNGKTIKPLIVNDLKAEEILQDKFLFRKYFELYNNKCRRILPIPSIYIKRNIRYSKTNSRSTKFRCFLENSKTKLLLSERIRNSELFKPIQKPNISNIKRTIKTSPSKPSITDNTKSFLQSNNNKNDNETNFLKISSVVSLNTTSSKELLDIQSISTKKETDLVKPSTNSTLAIKSIATKTDLLETPSTTINLQRKPDLLETPSTTITLQRKSNLLQKNSTAINLKRKSDNIFNNDNDSNDSKIINNNKNMFSDEIHKTVLKSLNNLVTKTMHNICKIQCDESKNIPKPVAESLHISQWRYFLQAYVEGIIHIWEVKVNNIVYFTVTMQNIMPFIRNAISVVNIKAIRKENLPLFGKMLNAKIIKEQTNSLSILMAGHSDYWRILGMTKSTIDYLTQGGVIKPTPQSHPWLSKKINILYEIMAKNRIDKIITKQENLDINISNNDNNSTSTNNDNINNNINSNDDIKYQNASIEIESIDMNDQLNRLMQTNIKIRQLTQREIIQDKFTIPLGTCTISNDYRWLVLDIVDDFSHILFSKHMECLSHNKIKIAFSRSNEEKKMVRLAKVGGPNVDCFVMKNDKDRIYLGPFELNVDPQIVLFQNIDSKMMLREDFEALHNIKRNISTTGFWLCRRNGKIIFDIDTRDKSFLPTLKNDTNIINQSNMESKENSSTFDETIIIDNDTTDGGNSNKSDIITNLKFNNNNNLQTLTQDIVLKSIEKYATNNINLPESTTTTTVSNLTNNSPILQQLIFENNKIPNNNNFGLKSILPDTNSENIKNTTVNILPFNKIETNLIHTQQSSLISLDPGVYEIKCSENTNNNKITTNLTSNMPIKTIIDPPVNKPSCNVVSPIKNQTKNKIVRNSKSTKKTIDGFILVNDNSLKNNSLLKLNDSKTSTGISSNRKRCKKDNVNVVAEIPVNNVSTNLTNNSKKLFTPTVKDDDNTKTLDLNKNLPSSPKICKPNKITNYEIKPNNIVLTDNKTIPINTNNIFPNVLPPFINIIPISTETSPILSISTDTISSHKLTSPVLMNEMKSSNLVVTSKDVIYNHNLKKFQISSNKNVSNKSSSPNSIKKSNPINNDINLNTANDNPNLNIKNRDSFKPNSRPRTIPGYFISNVRSYPRFGGMHREPNYLIKSSSNSALQLNSLLEVDKFLNTHVRKHCAAFKSQYLNVTWRFIPYKKSKFTTHKDKKDDQQQATTLNNVNNRRSCKINPISGTINLTQSVDENVIVIDDED